MKLLVSTDASALAGTFVRPGDDVIAWKLAAVSDFPVQLMLTVVDAPEMMLLLEKYK